MHGRSKSFGPCGRQRKRINRKQMYTLQRFESAGGIWNDTRPRGQRLSRRPELWIG